MKQTGIWLDKRIANVINLDEEEINVITVKSRIQETHIGGGSRSKQPYGPSEVSSESKLLQRKKQQRQEFFGDILEKLSGRDELYVFGPAETKIAFQTYLNNQNRIDINLLGVDTADSMTLSQKKAQVKKFFR